MRAEKNGYGSGGKVSGGTWGVRDVGRGTEDCARGSGEAFGGVCEPGDARGGVILYVGREARGQQRVFVGDQDERGPAGGVGEGSGGVTFVRYAGICGVADCGGLGKVFEVGGR